MRLHTVSVERVWQREAGVHEGRDRERDVVLHLGAARGSEVGSFDRSAAQTLDQSHERHTRREAVRQIVERLKVARGRDVEVHPSQQALALHAAQLQIGAASALMAEPQLGKRIRQRRDTARRCGARAGTARDGRPRILVERAHHRLE